MAEYRPLDLVYGHLGEPTYDSGAQKWHFPRDLRSSRQITPLGKPVKALAPTRGTEGGPQSALQRQNGIKQLVRVYPELSLARVIFSESDEEQSNAELMHGLLPELAQISEAIVEVASEHDPTTSEVLAFGKALDVTSVRRSEKRRYKEIVAVATGAAGEIVRLIVLTKERLGWETNKEFTLNTLTAQDGEEGWWTGNGTPIQQLLFAGVEKEASTWLAVRYHGAISILRPMLRPTSVCPSNTGGSIRWLPASRLDANHITTLPTKETGGVPFADVSFNPWDHQQIVVIDQSGQWSVWSIEAHIKGKGLWTAIKDSSGSLVDDEDLDLESAEPILDGWAKALWAGDPDTLLLASRRTFAIFNIKAKPRSIEVPDLALAKSADWILDLKRSPIDPSHFFVVTSSRLFWLTFSPFVKPESSEHTGSTATIMLSWIHFRDSHDISLSLSILGGNSQAWNPEKEEEKGEETMVVLYSRVNGLASIFTFHSSCASGTAASKCDPYLLPFTSTDTTFEGSSASDATPKFNDAVSCLRMISIPFGKSSPLSELQDPYETKAQLFQLSVLHRDLSLSECLYVGWTGGVGPKVNPPDICIRLRLSKTPTEVHDDFIVPDGAADEQLGDLFLDPVDAWQPEEDKKAVTTSLGQGSSTVEMTWLTELTSGYLSESHISPKRGRPKALSFGDFLQYIHTAVEDKWQSSRFGVDTLLELNEAEAIVTDVDDAATAMAQLLEKLDVYGPKNTDTAEDVQPAGPVNIKTSIPPVFCGTVGFNHDVRLSQVYDSLVKTYIGPLPPTPARVRIAIEKQLRNIAAQICLAAHTVRINTEQVQEEDIEIATQDSIFTLPVRRKGSIVSLKGKEIATQMSSPPRSSPTLPGAASINALPTPEPPTPSQRSARSGTPSGQSTRSVSSLPTAATTDEFREDPSSRRLRALTSLIPQPALPPKLANILTHWNVGADPATYDWDAAQRATALPDSAAIAAEEARRDRAAKRARKRAKQSMLLDEGDKAFKRSFDLGDEGTASQPELRRSTRVEARSQAVAVSSQVPESSQAGVGVNSQPVGGRFGSGRKGIGSKKGRKKGF